LRLNHRLEAARPCWLGPPGCALPSIPHRFEPAAVDAFTHCASSCGVSAIRPAPRRRLRPSRLHRGGFPEDGPECPTTYRPSASPGPTGASAARRPPLMRFFPFQRSLAASRWMGDANSRPIPVRQACQSDGPVFRFGCRDGSDAARDDREMLLRCGLPEAGGRFFGRQNICLTGSVIGPASDSRDESAGWLANHAALNHKIASAARFESPCRLCAAVLSSRGRWATGH